jgi:hypothetical protein
MASTVTLPFRVLRFLHRPVHPDAALDVLHSRLAWREHDFLGLAHDAIYAKGTSPYRRLLSLVGCEYGDLERLVRSEGIEGALSTLYRLGVYLSVDEFKGRRPIVRGSSTVDLDPRHLRNPLSPTHLVFQSGGSGGRATPVPLSLDVIRDRSVNACLFYEARGGRRWRFAFWGPPGGWSILQFLVLRGFGASIDRWFSLVSPSAPGLSARYRWSAHALRWGSALAGAGLPRRQDVPLDDPLPIARWMASVLASGGTPHLHTFVSPAVRLCRVASEAGINLHGAKFRIGGEPITQPRLDVIRSVGAHAAPSYGVNEAGEFIAQACLAPEAPDEVHFYHDLHALIQAGPAGKDTGDGGPGLPPRALLISSLRRTAPIILLNVSLGDEAVLQRRACGCPLERYGWVTHLHSIRSFEKLTAGGLTLLDTDVIRVLEQVLPARFGGGATDYQIVEEESTDGEPLLKLLVHPRLGHLDESAVSDEFLSAIGRGSSGGRVVELVWRQAGLVRVERRPPLATAIGKIHHLHRQTTV